MLPRTSHHDFNVQLQIHEGKGFPQILYGLSQDKDQRSISLKPGNEYVILLYPYGQLSTEGVKDISLEKRQCRLTHEAFKGSSHPTYTKDGCLCDCRVQKAFNTCKCVPWDFANGIKERKECDVFGRTCFFNRIENLTHTVDEACSYCQEECDWTRYRRDIIGSESITLKKRSVMVESISVKVECNKYICVEKQPRQVF